jgi:4-amino-4-deoxy-L-arabinose transferase-like glycosyltransferase
VRYLFPIVLVVTALALGFYAYLGGLRTPTAVFEATSTPTLLAGQSYVGKVQGQRFGELFREAKNTQENGRLGAGLALANVYYNNPETAHDTIRAFIGLAVADTTHSLPVGWRYRVVPAGQRIMRASIKGVSFLLAPDKLYPAATEAIKAQKLTQRGNFYLERFGTDETSEMWIGVK